MFARSLGLLACFLWCVTAFAEADCSPVDLRSEIGPPLDQGGSGYCFAHSSASLIRARLGFAVSPMHLAVLYLLTNPQELRSHHNPEVLGRLTPEFFELWKAERELDLGNYDPKKILTEDGLLNSGGDESKTILIANFFGLCSESRLPTGHNVYKKYLSMIRAFHRQRLQGKNPSEEAERPIGEIVNPVSLGMAWSYRLWVESQCGDTVRPSQPLIPGVFGYAVNLKEFRRMQSAGILEAARVRRNVMKVVDRELDRGNPVAVGYSLNDLVPSKLTTAKPKQPEVDHSSVFAARKRLGERCYYFLRNSFGNDLEGYRSRFRGRLEDGGVWVLPEEIPSLYSAVWLE